MNTGLGYTWFKNTFDNNSFALKEKLHLEYPFLFSVVFSRNCNLSCKHCLFLDDNYDIVDKNLFGKHIKTFVAGLPTDSVLIHEGRILEKWHIDILYNIRNQRPDIKIGLIDNGSYVKHYDTLLDFKKKGFMLDWIDISLDGSATTHNTQRNSKQAFEDAVIGIQKARAIAKSVNILTCVTTINANDIVNLYQYIKNQLLFETISERHLIDYSLTRRKESETLNLQQADYEKFRQQIKEINLDDRVQDKIKLRFYNANNLKLLLDIIGIDNTKDAIHNTITFQHSSIGFTIDGVEIYYFPQSISVSEVLVIDSDLHYYLPYSIKYKSKELFDRILGNKEIQNKYLVGDIINISRENLYKKGVVKFLNIFFDKHFEQESTLLKKYFTL